MSLRVPMILVDSDLVQHFHDKGYVIAPDGQGQFSLVKSAEFRASQARADRRTIAAQMKSLMRALGA